MWVQFKDIRNEIIKMIDKKMESSAVIKKKAYALSIYFKIKPIFIDDDDILAGHIGGDGNLDMLPYPVKDINLKLLSNKKDLMCLAQYMENLEEEGFFGSILGVHVAVAYDKLITEGISHKIKLLEEKYKCSIHSTNEDFYESMLILMKSFQQLILRYSKLAEEKYKKSGNINLKDIAEACSWIAFNPPKNLFESVQLLLITHECVVSEAGSGSISFGRLDQYLYPYYKKDIDEGVLTYKQAQKIISALWYKISELELSWQNVTIGGIDANGNDMCNDLTVMCMDASMEIRGDQPQLSLRVSKNMPQHIWDKAMELINMGMGFPELYNDELAMKAKINSGKVNPDEVWNYCIVGCVEIMMPGREYAHTEGARINWAKILENMLHNEKTWEIKNFSEFYYQFKQELKIVTETICNYIDIVSGLYPTRYPTPFTSLFMDGCIEKAKDVTDCGTIYNNLCINCVGFASTVDSLQAIEELVYKDKIVSLSELSLLLKNDFKDGKGLQNRMINCSKYGNDMNDVDSKANDLAEFFTEILDTYKLQYRDGKVQAGFYTSYFHADFGKLTGATPDGRKSGMPLSSSLSAMSGMDKSGPTALINSANSINMERFGNGMVLDMKFTSDFLKIKKHAIALQLLVEEYFRSGGMEIQFNIADKETLKKTQQNPQEYSNLIVRVSGFSAYFVSLDKLLQDEIINRMEQDE